MAGKLKKLVDQIVIEREKSNKASTIIRKTTLVRLAMKVGQDVGKFDLATPDDPVIEQKLRDAAKEMGVHLA